MDSPHLFGNYHGMFLDHSLKLKLFQLLLIKLRHPHSLHGTGLYIMPQFFQQANKSRLYVIVISYEYRFLMKTVSEDENGGYTSYFNGFLWSKLADFWICWTLYSIKMTYRKIFSIFKIFGVIWHT